MNIDLAGRIRNTNLPYKSALLPLFEAIVNSIHAIEELGIKNGRIDIYFDRDETQLSFDRDYSHIAPIINIVIEDNGIGFTDEHFNSFCTSDSTLKKAKGAKGIGRFVWLKAFDEVQIKSQFQQHGRYLTRSFDFVLSLTPMPNETYLGYFGYIPPYNAYIEIISYDKLLEDAKKRNRVLFDKLNLPR
jgi:anti-sigma regulatory factor (Ser/Thr protein kinase)